MAGEWYLGPAGDLRQLEVPETGLSVSEIRYGGVHQGLSGARTVDTTGIKMDINLNLNYLDETQHMWLRSMFTRHIPGPVYLVNPLEKNMMSKESAMSRVVFFDGSGVYSSTSAYQHAWEWEASYPTGVPGTRAVKRTGLPATSVKWQIDAGFKLPVTVGVTYCWSAYMKAVSSKTITFGIDWYDKTGAFISTSSSAESVTTSWARYDMSATAPTNAALAVPTWTSTTNVSFTSTALQFEVGATPTSWSLGGGTMPVMIDQMPAVSPRYPLRNVSLTLLEA